MLGFTKSVIFTFKPVSAREACCSQGAMSKNINGHLKGRLNRQKKVHLFKSHNLLIKFEVFLGCAIITKLF